MKKLQENAVGKLAASLLLLVFTFAGAVCGAHVLMGLTYMEADSWQETDLFYRALWARENDLASAYADMLELEENQNLTYVERQQLQDNVDAIREQMAPDATWFRYQIRSADGQNILFSNLEEGESLDQIVETVHYAAFVAGEHYTTQEIDRYEISYSLATDTSAENEAEVRDALVIECGVPEDVLGWPNVDEVLGDSDNVDPDVLEPLSDEFSQLLMNYISYQSTFTEWLIGCLVLLALALVSMLYVLWTGGHKAGVEGIVLTWQERIFFDLYLVVMACAGTAAFVGILCLCDSFLRYIYYAQEVMPDQVYDLIVLSASALAALFMGVVTLTLRTFVVRLKAHALARTTLICRIFGWLWRTCCGFVRSLPILWKAVAAFVVYFFANVMLFTEARYNGLVGLLWWLLNIAVLLLLCWWAMNFHQLRKGSQAIAAGNLEHQIDTHGMPHDLKAHAEDLNNISVGLASAVEEQMKSERFKAELITNVSHDLKTPLTSIINYVNLLKTTEQTDPKALEYIEVLDRKSQRLKKLTEDLVEASKASTGVLTVNREKIDMAQLIDQALGEWAEKLEARKLTVVTSLPDGETWVYADGRHLWRVIDNLLSNCSKYAMEGTRVYLDLSRGKGQVSLSVKNISREALNIPPERLMERFVRGEESRTTDGSGLGLSIARSLTELQGGTFELIVDGDLFKAMVTLPQAN